MDLYVRVMIDGLVNGLIVKEMVVLAVEVATVIHYSNKTIKL